MRTGRTGAAVGGWSALRRVVRLALLSALAVPALIGAGAQVQAAGPAPALQLSAHTAAHSPRTVVLVATLEAPAAGAPASSPVPVAGTEVTFSVLVSEFEGTPPLTIGSATTDAEGTATVTYTVTWTGPQTFVATATDSSGATIASATTGFTARQVAHPFAGTIQAVRPDASIGSAVADVLLVTVALLWITLITIVVRVNFGLAARRG